MVIFWYGRLTSNYAFLLSWVTRLLRDLLFFLMSVQLEPYHMRQSTIPARLTSIQFRSSRNLWYWISFSTWATVHVIISLNSQDCDDLKIQSLDYNFARVSLFMVARNCSVKFVNLKCLSEVLVCPPKWSCRHGGSARCPSLQQESDQCRSWVKMCWYFSSVCSTSSPQAIL